MKQYLILNAIGSIPEILVYGYIGAEYENGIIASDFVNKLKQLENENPTIHVKINSPGGNVFDGIAMYNAMKNCKATVHTYVVGVAASMGSIIALGGAKVYMSKSARIMTHQASGGVYGKADEMRANADLLESINKTMCGIYAGKTGFANDVCTTKFLSNTDTWFNAQQALAEKLIDGIYDADEIDMPANITGVAALWGHYNNHFLQQTTTLDMNITLSAAHMTALKLTANYGQAEFEAAMSTLMSNAAKVDQLTASLADANLRATNAENALNSAKEVAEQQSVDGLIAQATKDGRINAATGVVLKGQYKGNSAGLKAVLDVLPKYASITGAIDTNNEANESELRALMAKDYDALDKSGKLERLRALSEDSFQAKYQEKFGKKYGSK